MRFLFCKINNYFKISKLFDKKKAKICHILAVYEYRTHFFSRFIEWFFTKFHIFAADFIIAILILT